MHAVVSSDRKAGGIFFPTGRKKYSFRYRKELKLKGEKGVNRSYSSLINLNFLLPTSLSFFHLGLELHLQGMCSIYFRVSLSSFFPHSVDVLCYKSTLSFFLQFIPTFFFFAALPLYGIPLLLSLPLLTWIFISPFNINSSSTHIRSWISVFHTDLSWLVKTIANDYYIF